MQPDILPPLARDGDRSGQSEVRGSTRGRRLGVVAGVLVLAVASAIGGRLWLEHQVVAALPASAPPPPPAVTVSVPLLHRMASWTSFTGQFSAVDRVEIRAQVSGFLTEIHFVDGQLVKKGDLLFVIDPRPYAIALEQAKALLQTAEAGLDLSNKQLNRTTELKRSDFASGETLDQRVQQQRGAQATLEQAKASVDAAALNLEFTRIIAPQSGRISAHRVSIGALIGGGLSGGATTLLTTIVSLDPIQLDFDMSESDYLAYQRFLQASGKTGTVDRTVEASLSDEETWKHRGLLDFVDNELDRSSGTIHARARLDNKDLFIAPGQFARLRLPTTAASDVLLVPDAALVADQSNKLVMTVAPDGTVVPKAVETGPLAGTLRVVKSGLGPNDRVIINGLMRSRPGTKVTPQQGTIAAPPAEG